jgi:IPT/TIG domain/Regulator of chromosome condensation (RCC1) repeat
MALLAIVLIAVVLLPEAATAEPISLSGLAPALGEAAAGGPSAAPQALAAEAIATRAAFRAAKGSVKGVSLVPSAIEPHWRCPESSCDAIVDPPARSVTIAGRHRFVLPQKETVPLEGSGVHGGYDPQDLQSAYKVSASGGAGQTVAVVDAYGYSEAEEDLAVYRSKYGLPPCTKADGCFHKVNQHGEERDYPPDESSWDGEAALDLDMVSAMCPECHVILAEGDEPTTADLEEAVEAAGRMGATEISNSYGGPENERELDAPAYDQPGVMIFASAGDDGYDNHERGWEAPNFPAALSTVIAVGGTNLRKATNARGWEDTVWRDGGSGCSELVPKPPWQHDSGCAKRISDDVAAVASCETPVSTYMESGTGWELVCGTSVSSPLVAGIEAHAGAYARSLPGADAFYDDPGGFFDVTSGSNGTCTPPESHAYWCNAEEGYDGPTGNGVPDGPLSRTQAPPAVTTSDEVALSGTTVTVKGEIDPQGEETSYQFEYGTGSGYTATAPVPAGSLPASTEARQVSATIEGLQPHSGYHFRLAATNAGGSSYGSDYQFSTAAPTISGVSPDAGPPDGDTTVTITGANFQGATAVHFGSREAQEFVVQSPETISAVSPLGTGVAQVTVTTPAGTSEANPAYSFSYAPSGPVLGWGINEDQLGDGQTSPSEVPVEVSALGEVVGLAAGGSQSLAVLGDGRVMGWGENWSGGVGNETHGPQSTPVPVCAPGVTERCPNGPYLEEVTQVASGDWFSVALQRDGRVLTWGTGGQGELGRGEGFLAENAYVPRYVCAGKHDTASHGGCAAGHYLEEVVQIAAAGRFTVALLRSGTVMTWGENAQGQLGTGKTKGPESCLSDEELENGKIKKIGCSRFPVQVPGLSGVVAVAAGGEPDIGSPSDEEEIHLPGGSHVLALLGDGKVMAWGNGADGELGDGTIQQQSKPVAVCASGEKAPCAHDLEGVSAVAAGETTSMALLGDGSVLDWGDDTSLGDGSLTGPEQCAPLGEGFHETCSTIPLAPTGLPPVRTIATGGDADLAVATDGQIFTWGSNFRGHLGTGDETYASAPVRVCAAFAEGPCPGGPYLEGQVTAVSEGRRDALIGFEPGHALVEHVSPETGPGAGGTTVTITGKGLSGTTAVDFGASPAASFEVRSEDEVIATAPAGAGTVDVRVLTPEGETPVREADRYTYQDSTVTAVSPSGGPQSGGTRVTITGTKLQGAGAVNFGAVPATEVEVLSESEIQATSPAGHGTVDVEVTTPEGTSHATDADHFSYVSPPEVTTEAATEVRESSAVLHGSYQSPKGTHFESCRWEWGLSEAYEHTLPCEILLTGTSSLTLRGLSPGTTYHYRYVASNDIGTAYGEDEAFTTASSGLPELGRCVQRSPALGRYQDKHCTVPSSGEDSGGYEWEPGPGADPAFTGSGGALSVDPGSSASFTCSASQYRGRYTGGQSATLQLTLGGCEAFYPAGKCHSEGAGEGEVLAEPLLLTLGPVRAAKTPVVGWELASPPGTSIATATCGAGEQLTISGAVIGTVKSVDHPSSTFRLQFKLSSRGGNQTVAEFEGGPGDELWLLRDSFLSTQALSANVSLQGEEPLEIKAVP